GRAGRVLVDAVGHVGGRDAVDGLRDTVAGRVVDVLEILRRQTVGVRGVGREDGVRQLAVGVVGVDPLAVLVRVDQDVAHRIVGVGVGRVDRGVVGRVVDDRLHVAGGVVGDDGARAVAHVLLGQLAGGVVGVLHDQVVAAVGQLLQPAVHVV